MLDYRIYTFIKLCDVKNYRIASEELGITQPAVTQHIQFLEREYNCSLFHYNGKKLIQTPAGKLLEEYARSAAYNDGQLRKKIAAPTLKELRIGATKTIGNYIVPPYILNAMEQHPNLKLSLYIENTEQLLLMLNQNKLDFALIEGFFDKGQYDYQLYRKEPFVGICPVTHAFANQQVELEDIFDYPLILRESGSGTRAILEQVLLQNNYTLNNFKQINVISSFDFICAAVEKDFGISFVYEEVAKHNPHLATFTLKDKNIVHEFNFVYLKNTRIKDYTALFQN